MRRVATVVLVLLLVLFGGYTALWFYVSSRMADEIAQWAGEQRLHRRDVSWDKLRMGGYPLAFSVTANEVRFRDLMPGRAGEIKAPLIEASTRPWNFRSWAIDAPSGLTAIGGPADAPRVRLTSQSASGSVAIDAGRDIAVTVDLQHPAFENGERVAARAAIVSASLPQEPARSHADASLGLAIAAYDLQVPGLPAPFRGAINELAFDIRMLGPIPDLPLREAAAAWRDAGGTIEVEKIAARSGDFAVTGSGTVALDREMQPEAAFSGSVRGYDRLIAGLSEIGVLPLGGSVLATVGLSLLAKPAADGHPQIKTSFTIQNGEMSLGPIKLGNAPHIEWE
ncbi:MAG: DUF2125 domain-containing protein [Alphaproteobacteria bacterium]